MAKLEHYFKGQKNWLEFSESFDNLWTHSDLQETLLMKLNHQIELAKVIYYHTGEKSLDWINKKIPALDNLTPMECLKTEKTTDRLKVCLMRMK